MDLGLAVITVEQRGIDGHRIDPEEFIAHYTRSQRLDDHKDTISFLKANPFEGWNGKFVFIGVSEGGPLVSSLTSSYAEDTVASIIWSGAGNWTWREELWAFMQNLIEINPDCPHCIPLLECEICSKTFTIRDRYNDLMDLTIENPSSGEFFLNMSHLYHADAQTYPKCQYSEISSPLLVVNGALDTTIDSCDEFISRALDVGAPVTYMRVPDMDHYVRMRPDIIEASFMWLSEQIELANHNLME
jgi:hypothetical protein